MASLLLSSPSLFLSHFSIHNEDSAEDQLHFLSWRLPFAHVLQLYFNPLTLSLRRKWALHFTCYCCSCLVPSLLKPISLTQSASALSISLPPYHRFQPVNFDVVSSHLPKRCTWEFSLSFPKFCRALPLVLSHHRIFATLFLQMLSYPLCWAINLSHVVQNKVLDSMISIQMCLMIG